MTWKFTIWKYWKKRLGNSKCENIEKNDLEIHTVKILNLWLSPKVILEEFRLPPEGINAMTWNFHDSSIKILNLRFMFLQEFKLKKSLNRNQNADHDSNIKMSNFQIISKSPTSENIWLRHIKDCFSFIMLK